METFEMLEVAFEEYTVRRTKFFFSSTTCKFRISVPPSAQNVEGWTCPLTSKTVVSWLGKGACPQKQ
jgi:hypothetical protein